VDDFVDDAFGIASDSINLVEFKEKRVWVVGVGEGDSELMVKLRGWEGGGGGWIGSMSRRVESNQMS
jgi:hypothetical protein